MNSEKTRENNTPYSTNNTLKSNLEIEDLMVVSSIRKEDINLNISLDQLDRLENTVNDVLTILNQGLNGCTAQLVETEMLCQESEHQKVSLKKMEDKCVSATTEESENEDLRARLMVLEEVLMHCFLKQKNYKAKMDMLAQKCSNLEMDVRLLNGWNEDLRRELKLKIIPIAVEDTSNQHQHSATTSSSAVTAIMHRFPRPANRPMPIQLKPIHTTEVDLRDYLRLDIRTQGYTENFLYLPEATVFCSDQEDHAFAFGPTFFCDKNNRFKLGSTFTGLYDKAFNLFFSRKSNVFYAGSYKGIDFRSVLSDGVAIREYSGMISPHALAEATLSLAGDPALRQERLHMISRLYQDGILKAECMGLQNIGFDYELYHLMTERYAMDLVLGQSCVLARNPKPFYPLVYLTLEDFSQQAPVSKLPKLS